MAHKVIFVSGCQTEALAPWKSIITTLKSRGMSSTTVFWFHNTPKENGNKAESTVYHARWF